MYPSAQLKQLALEKELLERRIDVNRARCVIEWNRLRRPIEIADNLVAQVRRFAPMLKLLAVPLGFAAVRRRRGRAQPKRRGKLSLLFKWAPIVLGVVRSWRANREMKRETSTVQRRARAAVR